MSETAQMHRQDVEMFPAKIDTVAQSFQFMQNTLAVCISSIAYLRNIFREDEFRFKQWEGCRLPILTTKSCEGKRVKMYMLGIIDALQKGFLKEVPINMFSTLCK